jgi:hypothetical protein
VAIEGFEEPRGVPIDLQYPNHRLTPGVPHRNINFFQALDVAERSLKLLLSRPNDLGSDFSPQCSLAVLVVEESLTDQPPIVRPEHAPLDVIQDDPRDVG